MNLEKEELLSLFRHSIENAHSLYVAANNIATSKSSSSKHPALGLAELALEELGKSYSCLAHYSISDILDDWNPFWKDWRSHETKAHRAFLYEFFSVLRLELYNTETNEAIPTKNRPFSKEKELAFYVDINKQDRKIFVPSEEVSDVDVLNRISSLLGIISTALYVLDWMQSDKEESFKDAISEYAYTVLTREFYLQDVEKMIELMKGENQSYNEGLDSILNMFRTSITS